MSSLGDHNRTASYRIIDRKWISRGWLSGLMRWNSTHDMICRALEQQAPVAAIILEKKLANLELSAQEWSQLEKVQ
uniref:uncharacterized protein ajm1 isoform X2 n=1 Tax=Epinephelus lanceolatus TaxID=310571 RepID=UPI0014475A33|nr:uncharacterized protein ajm1 isoform X2 [Epinephelus lanceolatus]